MLLNRLPLNTKQFHKCQSALKIKARNYDKSAEGQGGIAAKNGGAVILLPPEISFE